MRWDPQFYTSFEFLTYFIDPTAVLDEEQYSRVLGSKSY